MTTQIPSPTQTLAASSNILAPSEIRAVLIDALRKFDPRYLWRNPVLLLTEVGAALTTVIAIAEPFLGGARPSGGTVMPPGFTWALALGFWLCLYSATLAESISEGRGRKQTQSLRQVRTDTIAKRVINYDYAKDRGAKHAVIEEVDSHELKAGDVVVVEAGDVIPADGEVLWGAAEIDEAEFTGHSGTIIRKAGGDRTAVTGGTLDLSDRLVVRITASFEESTFERTIRLASKSHRKKAPIEVAFGALLASFSLSFVIVALTLNSVVSPVAPPVSIPVLVALVICLIPTEVAALMSVTGIAGMSQLLRRGVLVTSAKSLETAGDITTVLLDKTGTVTKGNRSAIEFLPLSGVDRDELILFAAQASIQDPTPEGESIVQLAAKTGIEPQLTDPANVRAVPFSAASRISGLDLADGTKIRKGAVAATVTWLKQHGTQPQRHVIDELQTITRDIARGGGTPLVVAIKPGSGPGRALGVVHLQDVVKDTVPKKISLLRALGIRTVMVTGDHELAAKAISEEAGIDEYVGNSTPEDKLALIVHEQELGHLVAMSGDGVNDAPALAQADIGIAMNNATSAAKEAANMIILDDDPAHLVDIIEVGRRQMSTRGALMTFNFANDVVRYFTLFPALFVGVFPGLTALNVLQLHSPASAILSTVLFSSVVMVILIPLALIGVPYRSTEPGSALTRNLIVNGLSGVLVPIIAIKLIDMVVSLLPGY
ncbi:potassium-transporting ATPase subunit KdpB [Leucobacter insecticola]|uniref:Potassium-transporting ATPase ATP-binding subunit n=1 Tax=Leucobacter insecticola TaxID=2714934 RepID=A0A6G8FKC0_9MICO|nr:potassium-transporting ATPase subunit KdpB [Leucobacter insecticola]QIM16729.1 potassium-transporting ATPase subunit KdpB [Leucobacter insecticola]